MLLFTDLHLHHTWLERSRKFLEFLSDVIERNDVKNIIHLGDVFEEKDRVPNDVKKVLLDFIDRHQDCNFYWLKGNHESRVNDITTIEFLSNIPGHTLIKEPQVISIEGKKCYFVPHNSDYRFTPKLVDLVFLHNDIRGFKFKTGYVMSQGIDLVKILECNARYYFAGHIHEPCLFSDIFYLGAPYERDFRDRSTDLNKPTKRGVYILNNDLQFIPFVSDRYLKVSVSSNSDVLKSLKKIKSNYIDKGYHVYVWFETSKIIDVVSIVDEFGRDGFKNVICVNETKDSDVEDVTVSTNVDLLPYLYKHIPYEYRSKNGFMELGSEILKCLGFSLEKIEGGENSGSL